MKKTIIFLAGTLLFLQTAISQNIDPSIFNRLALRNIGPAKASGRVVDIAIDPHKRSTRYVATASGNVWKTVNAGTTWEPIFENYGSYSTGTIEIDPNNSQVLWLGTGENNAQRSVGFGDGAYKSTDAGKTWQYMGLKTSEHIGKIMIDPRDSDVVFVAAQGSVWKEGGERGLYKTTDGGKTWERAFYVSENTGISDIIFDPRDPDIMLISSYQRRRHFGMLVAGGPDGGIWKSTDAGETWRKLSNGLPGGDIGRIGLAFSPQKPDVTYALIAGTEETEGFYRSENQGDSWKKMSKYHSTDTQYYMELFPDPHQFDRILTVDVHLKATDDGGRTFYNLNTRQKHVDNHEIEFDPEDPDYLMVGCDGGIYETWDRGANWKFTDNLQIVQFYRVGIDNAKPFYNVYGGTQDNATLGGPSQTLFWNGIRNQDWYITRGGDGFQTRVDPNNPNIIYSQSQYAGIVRYDRQSGERIGIQPQPEAGEAPFRWNWDSPLILSPHASERLYFAANKVFKSEDGGNSWKVISPDLTKQMDRNKMEIMDRVWSIDAVFKNVWTSPYGTIVAMDESPLEEDLLYVGTDDGWVQISEDGGENWRRAIHLPGLPEWAYASDIHASRTDANTVFAVFNNHKYGDYEPYLYKSTDRGMTWQQMNSNLKSPDFAWSIFQDHIDPQLLFLGTEFGLWFSLDGGNQWIEFQAGIPTIAIRDLEIHRGEDDLVAASFGRGFFILDDYSILRNLDAERLAEDHQLFPVKDALSYLQHNPIGGALGNSFFTSPNPPFGAIISYYNQASAKSLKQQRQAKEREKIQAGLPIYYPDWEELHAENRENGPIMVLSIRDQRGNLIRRLTGPASKGIHRIDWDLRTRWRSQTGSEERSSGTLVPPGTYSVSLSKVVNGVWTDIEGSQSFEVIPLLHTSQTIEHAEKQAGFRGKVNSLRQTMFQANELLEETIKDVKNLRRIIIENASDQGLLADAKAIQDSLENLHLALNGDAFAVKKMELIPPSPMRRVNGVYWSFSGTRGAATKTHLDGLKIAADEFKDIMKKLDKVLDYPLRNLERSLEEEGFRVRKNRTRIIWD